MVSRAILLGALLSGCVFDPIVDPDARVTCSADSECPDDQRCIVGLFQCGVAEGPCIDDTDGSARAAPDGIACGADNDATICVTGRCIPGSCGDGALDARTETCDEGAENSSTTPNSCRDDCALPRCGDGIIDDFESCDGTAGNAQTCALCVASCSSRRGDCDGDDNDLCDCSPEVISPEPVPFASTITFAVDDDGLFWMGGDGDLRRTPISGGPSEQLSPPPGRNDVTVRMEVDALAVWRIAVDIQVQVPHLYRNDKLTGTEQDYGAASTFALDPDALWVAIGGLFRLDYNTGDVEAWFTTEPYSVTGVVVAETFVATIDDAARVHILARSGAPDPRLLAERQFSTTNLQAHGDVLVWADGSTVYRWQPGAPAVEQMPRLSDGQQGLPLRSVTLDADKVWLALEDRSNQRPGGIMRVDVGARRWTQQMRSSPFQLRWHDGFLYFSESDGFFRTPAP